MTGIGVMRDRFIDLIDTERLKKLLESFHALTGIPSALIADDGTLLRTRNGDILGAGWQRICLDFHRVDPRTNQRCIESDTVLSRKMAEGEHYACYRCLNGLVDAAVPVMIEGRRIAILFTGQFLFEPPDREAFRRQAREFGFHEEDYLAALDEVPVFPEAEVQKALRFLTVLAELIADMGAKQKELLESMEAVERKVVERTAELARAKRVAEAAEHSLLEAQHIAHLGSWDWNVATGELIWSDEVYRIFGCNPRGFRGTYAAFMEIIHPEDRGKVAAAVRQALEDPNTPYDVEHRIVLADGSQRVVHERGAVYRDAAGQPLRMLGTVLDITDRKRAEERLTGALREAQTSNAELEQFAYAVSHDLQEPLRMVSSYMQLIERRLQDRLEPEDHEFIGYAVDGAKRMGTLIHDLLDFSRITSRGDEMKATPAAGALSEALSNLQAAIAESGAVIEAGPLPTVRADAPQLARLFQNLVGNALKYRHPDRPCMVRISAERRADTWAISVTDNGIGMEERDLERIFGVFQRLHGPGKYEGTGIGLAIARRIAERHGGDIAVASRPGEGSTFTVILPADQAASSGGATASSR